MVFDYAKIKILQIIIENKTHINIKIKETIIDNKTIPQIIKKSYQMMSMS